MPTSIETHDNPLHSGKNAACPLGPHSSALSALQMLAMGPAIAPLRALPGHPIATRSGTLHCRT